MSECLQKRQNVLSILPHHAHNDFRTFLKDALLFESTECVHYIRCQSEGHYLGYFEFCAFLENTVEINVRYLTSMQVN